MAKSVRELEVFIASPSDVGAERHAVRSAVDIVNQTFASDSEFPRLLATGWEQVSPTFGRPQEQINELVSTCDIFIGILGNRFGSFTGTHESGFLEEYEEAVSRRNSTGEPHIALYFRRPPRAMLDDPGTELKRVLDFKKRVKDNHEILYGEFESEAEFQGHLRDLLTELIVANRQKIGLPEGAITTGGGVPVVQTETELDGAQKQITDTLLAFADLVRGAKAHAAHLDKDRLLQVALLFQEPETVLPVHASNRLYLNRKQMILARGEFSLWLDTLLQQYRSSPATSVSPGWFLVTSRGASPRPGISSEIAKRLQLQQPDLVNGALYTLRRGRLRPPELWDVTSDLEAAVVFWRDSISISTDPALLTDYLLAVSQKGDEALLDGVSSAVDHHAEVFLGVLAALRRDSAALNGLVDRRAFKVLKWPQEIVAGHLELLLPENLKRIVEWSDDDALRVRAFESLQQLDNLDEPTWGFALTSAKTSDLARKALQAACALSQAERDAIANVVEQGKADGMTEILIRLRLPDLGELGLTADTLENVDYWEAASWGGDVSLLDHARQVLRTGGQKYSRHFESLDEGWAAGGDPAQIIDFVRAKARIAAMRVLKFSSPLPLRSMDAKLIAAELETQHWLTAEEALEALLEIGETSNADVLLERVLENPYTDHGRERLRRALKLVGATKVLELVHSDVGPVAAAAAAHLSDDNATTIDQLRPLLYSSDSTVRIHSLRGVIRRSSRSDLEALLDAYPTQGENGTYYYNIVAALDDHLYGPESPEFAATFIASDEGD